MDTREIINNTLLTSLATNTDNGIWVSDVIHVSDNVSPALYWISNPVVKHSQALENDQECALSITKTQNAGEQKVGLQMQGFAHEFQGDSLMLCQTHASKQQIEKPSSSKEYIENDKWYVFFPYSIDIFDETKSEKEHLTILDKKIIKTQRDDLVAKGYPYTFLWFDKPGHQYPLHKHTKPVYFNVLYGSITFTYEDGSVETISAGQSSFQDIGSIHSAIVGELGCVHLVGQVDKDEPTIEL